jgi:hypothetical protein
VQRSTKTTTKRELTRLVMRTIVFLDAEFIIILLLMMGVVEKAVCKFMLLRMRMLTPFNFFFRREAKDRPRITLLI